MKVSPQDTSEKTETRILNVWQLTTTTDSKRAHAPISCISNRDFLGGIELSWSLMASAKQHKKTPAPSAPMVPDMPDLDINIDVEDDGEDDPQDENHLMNILQKLKSAKHTLDSTRQK